MAAPNAPEALKLASLRSLHLKELMEANAPLGKMVWGRGRPMHLFDLAAVSRHGNTRYPATVSPALWALILIEFTFSLPYTLHSAQCTDSVYIIQYILHMGDPDVIRNEHAA